MIELFELQNIDTGFVLGLLLTATTLIINELI
jgi:hypothetical protein